MGVWKKKRSSGCSKKVRRTKGEKALIYHRYSHAQLEELADNLNRRYDAGRLKKPSRIDVYDIVDLLGARLAFEYLIHIISRPDYKLFVSDRMYRLLVSDRDLIIDILAILILFIVSFIRKKKDMMLDEYLMGKSYAVRATVMLILLFFIILFGHYGEDVYTQPFVYFQF